MSEDGERFVRLSNRARNDEPVDDGDIRAAFDAVVGEEDMGAARALQTIAERDPDRLAAYTDDLQAALETCSDGTVRSNLYTVLKEVSAVRSTLPFEVADELVATIRQGDPLLAAEGIAALTASVRAGQALPEEFVQEVFYRVGRSPNDYVMSIGGEFLRAVVEAGGDNAVPAFEAFGVLLEEDQSDMTVVLGQVLVDLLLEAPEAVPADADTAMVRAALAQRREETGLPDNELTTALETLGA